LFLLARKLLYLVQVGAEVLHHRLQMAVEILGKSLVDVVLDLPSDLSNLVIEHSNSFQVLGFELRAFVTLKAAYCGYRQIRLLMVVLTNGTVLIQTYNSCEVVGLVLAVVVFIQWKMPRQTN
jgi:hypothetical protein